MRFTFSALALFAAFAIPAAAYATTITISIDGGAPNTYTLANTASYFGEGRYSGFDAAPGGGSAGFYAPDYSASEGWGQMDLSWYNGTASYFFTGVKLYSGDESDPVLTPGSYDLGTAPQLGDFHTATLVVNAGAVTPEPSSLALLGTGLMGLVSISRFRSKA